MTTIDQNKDPADPNLALTGSNDRRKKLLFGVIASCLLTVLIYTVIEIRYPFFFSTDDNADWYTSEYVHVIRTLLSGKFPMYSFTQFCGQRTFANGQSGTLNLVMYVAAFLSKLIFGDYHALIEILTLLTMLLGSIGAYFLLERLGACQAAAIAGAVVWNINTYNTWVGSSWILVIMTTGILPFIIYGSIRLCEKPSLGNYLWAIIPKAVLYFIGHPQFFLYAAIFDCLFVGMYALLCSDSHHFRNFFKTVGRYAVVYVCVLILILPQLIPQYQMMGMTKHASALTYQDFTAECNSIMVGMFWPFYSGEGKVITIDPFTGYPLLITGFAGALLPMLLITSERKNILKHKKLLLTMLATLPGIIISFLAVYSDSFLHLLYKIPVINRFHFLHRNIIYLTSLCIIFSVMSCTFFWRYISGNRKKKNKKQAKNKARVLGSIFVILEVINMALVFTLQPQLHRGPMYKAEEGYDEEYAARFKEGRYVSIGYWLDSDAEFLIKHDLAHSLRYNLASYYGLNNVSGYYGVYTNDAVGTNLKFFENIVRITGDLWYPYPEFIKEMRSQSVNWYILNPDSRNYFAKLLENAGMQKVYEDEYGIVYFDPECEPPAFDEQGKKVDLEQGDVNYLKLNTDSDFAGGIITLNYSYDSNFKCFIDGNETPLIDDNANWQMKLDCPAGSHDIEIRYVDTTFNTCCIITGSFIALSIAGCVVYTVRKKKIAG